MVASLPPSSRLATICGAAVVSAREFASRKMAPGSFDRAIGGLDTNDRHELSGIVSPLHWYPLPTYQHLLDRLNAMSQMRDFYEKLGQFGAELEIHTFYKFILRFASPQQFIERATRVWSRYHDTGRWEMVTGDRRIRGTQRDFALPHVGMCRALSGWFTYAGKLTGAPQIVVTHPECRAVGGRACVFEAEW